MSEVQGETAFTVKLNPVGGPPVTQQKSVWNQRYKERLVVWKLEPMVVPQYFAWPPRYSPDPSRSYEQSECMKSRCMMLINNSVKHKFNLLIPAM